METTDKKKKDTIKLGKKNTLANYLALSSEDEKMNQKDYEFNMKMNYARINNPTTLQTHEYECSVNGGKCIYCEKEWIKNRVKNSVAEYENYIPDCECIKNMFKQKKFDKSVNLFNYLSKVPEKYHHVNLRDMDRGVDDSILQSIEKVKDYIKKRKYENMGLILFGNIGTGKTHMAISVLKAIAIKERKSTIYFKTSDLINEIVSTKGNIIKDIVKNQVILLDDIDKLVSKGSDWRSETVFSLIDGIVSNNRILIATSNLTDIDDFSECFDSSVVSRLVGSCMFIPIKGDDYRFKKRGVNG